MGKGDTLNSTLPTTVLFYGTAPQLAQMCLGYEHSCGVTTTGLLYCWGANGSGQLGTGDNQAYHRGYPVPGISGVASVHCGTNHTCARLNDGTVRCWGANTYGQLGDGTYTNRNVVGSDLGLTGVTKLALGASHSCALHTDGTVSCWGRSIDGQVAPGYGQSFSDLQVVVGLE